MHTILIAEDNPVFAKLISSVLGKHSDKLNVIYTENGREAIKVLNQQQISLLVTDIEMPEMNGFDLLNYKNEKFPELPCIVMTAHEAVKWRIAGDIISFLPKPFKVEELVNIIFQTFEKKSPSGSIDGISVYNFLQLIEMEQKTCLFEVRSDNDENGLFFFKDGILFNAFWGKESGEKAALKIIGMENVRIRFKDLPQKKIPQEINKGLMALIMDAMRRKDECKEG